MADNDNCLEGEFKQGRGGGKMTKRNTQETTKPYDRPISTFGRIFAAVKDILKPALVTDAMSRVHDAQKDHGKMQNVDKFAVDAGYEILRDSSESDDVLVEVEGYQAVFKSHVLHDEMCHLKSKLVDAVSSSEQSCEQQLRGRQNTLERSTSQRLDSPMSITPSMTSSAFPNKTSMPSGIINRQSAGISRYNEVTRTFGYDTVTATNRNDTLQERTVGNSTNTKLITTPSRTGSTNGAPSTSYRRFGAESSETKPGFKMSRFCESIEKIRAGTSLLNRSRAEMAALSESCTDSSFYAGRTSYGGAASAYKMNPKTTFSSSTSPYQTRPTVRKCIQVSGGSGGETKVLSVTAQRILDTMETIDESSRRLNRSYDAGICSSPLSFTPSYRRNSSQFAAASNGATTRPCGGPPVKQLVTPSVSVLKPTKATIIESREPYENFRQKLADEQMDTRAAGTLRETGYTLPVGNAEIAGFENIRSSASSLIGKCKKPPKHYVSGVRDVDDSVSDSALSSIRPFSSSNLFSGSSGIDVATKTAVSFSFSMPKESVISDETALDVRDSEGSLEKYIFSPPKIMWMTPEIDTSRSESVFSTRKNVSLATSSAASATSDHAKLGGATLTMPLTALFKKLTNVWTCQECYVDNKCTDTVCVACMNPRPVIGTPSSSIDKGSTNLEKSHQPISQSTTEATSGFTLNAGGGFKFGSGPISNTGFGSGAREVDMNFSSNNSGGSKLAGGFRFSGSFDAETKTVQQKGDVDTLCDLTRPPLRSDIVKSQEPVQTSTEESTGDNQPLSKLFKKPADVWTCNECYITNKNEENRCISCEASKPSTSGAPLTQFSFNATKKAPGGASNPEGNGESSTVVKPLSELFMKPADSWTCAECFVLNKSLQTKCLSCDTVKPGKATLTTSQPVISLGSTSAAKPLSELFKKPVNVWTCNECYVTNKSDRTTCQSCETAKPRAAQPSSLSSTSDTTRPLSELFKKPVDVWTCSECYVANKDDRTSCQSCETTRLSAKQVLPSLAPVPHQVISSDAKPLSELFKKPTDVWTCNECYVSNKNDRTNCQSCETVKPSARIQPSLAPVPAQVVSSDAKPLSELFKKHVDTWTCNECYVSNKNDRASCQSCETVRPGTSVPIPVQTSVAPMFTFGAPNPSAFGSSSTGQAASTASFFSSTFSGPSTFKFGQASTESTTTHPIQFGQSSQTRPNDSVAGLQQSFSANAKTPMFGFSTTSQPRFGATVSNLSTSAENVSTSNASGFGTGFKINVTGPVFGNSSSSAAPLTGASSAATSASSIFGSSAAPPMFGAPSSAANPFVFGAPVPMFSSASVSDTKMTKTGFGASSTTIPTFGASTGSNTFTPQFGTFPASFSSPAQSASIIGSCAAGSAAPAFSNPQFGSNAVDSTKTSSISTTFKFGSGDSQPTSSLFTFGRQTTENPGTGSSFGNGDGLAKSTGKRSIEERTNGDMISAKHPIGNFTFGTPSTNVATFGQFPGAAAPVQAATSSSSQGFNFNSSIPMFNVPSANAVGIGGMASGAGVFQFGSSGSQPPSFQNPFDVASTASSAGSVSNRIIKRAERRLNKPRR